MSIQHTPGPWTVYTADDGILFVEPIPNKGSCIAKILGRANAAEANARLIAAAPELLETLREIDKYLNPNPLNYVGSDSILHNKIQAAIDRATGNETNKAAVILPGWEGMKPGSAKALDWEAIHSTQVANANLTGALRNLIIMARTSGGTAGPDPDLMEACNIAENVLANASNNIRTPEDRPAGKTPEFQQMIGWLESPVALAENLKQLQTPKDRPAGQTPEDSI